VILTERGPVMIDMGARLGGGTHPDICDRLLGVSQTQMLIDAIMRPYEFTTRDAPHEINTPAMRMVWLINRHAGQVTAEPWRQRIENLPTALQVLSPINAGDYLPATIDLLTTPGYVYLAANSWRELEDDYYKIRDWERAGLYTTIR
jgi:hypothetical protein